MSTVIGLVKKGRPLEAITTRLEAAGCAIDQIKILTDPREVHTLLDKTAMTKCQMSRCVSTGALIGLAFFVPVGFVAALVGCTMFGCHPLVWLITFGGLSLIGGLFGAAFGCFFGADRFERGEHVYAEAVGWGNKLVVVDADTPEVEADATRVLEQEQAIGVKIQ